MTDSDYKPYYPDDREDTEWVDGIYDREVKCQTDSTYFYYKLNIESSNTVKMLTDLLLYKKEKHSK